MKKSILGSVIEMDGLFTWTIVLIALIALIALVIWHVTPLIYAPLPWRWPAVATRVFASDPAVFEGSRHLGMTRDPDGGHPDDATGLLSWWRQEPLRWRAEVQGCSRYSCPAATDGAAEVPACDPRADTLTKSSVSTFTPHPTRREVREKAAYRDLARYCANDVGHDSCQSLKPATGVAENYTANVLGALVTHPVIPGQLQASPPPPFRAITQPIADALAIT